MKIRDLRKKDQYKIDDAYLNGYAKLCGIYATAVYNSLSRHADFHKQECFPSIEKIAEQHAISKPSVIKGIKKLEEWNIIKIIKEKDSKTKRQLPNVYILIDKTEWKEKPRVNDVDSENIESRVNVRTEPSKRQSESRVNDVDCKDNTDIKDTQFNVCSEQSSQDIVDFINLFKTINPIINFGNKTTRKAAADLINQFGKEKAIEYATYAISVFGKPYAPTITTPYELREKLSKLAVFHTSEKNKKEKTIVTKI